MKYLINETNSCGQASLSEAVRTNILESLGYTAQEPQAEIAAPAEEVDTNEYVQQDAPALYEWDSSFFAMTDEVFEIEGDLFVLAEELDGETTAKLDESHADLFINDVTFDSSEYSLGDVYEMDGKTYVKLSEGKKKGDKSADKKKKGDKPDFETGARKGDENEEDDGKDFSFKKKGKKKAKKKLDEEDDYEDLLSKNDDVLKQHDKKEKVTAAEKAAAEKQAAADAAK